MSSSSQSVDNIDALLDFSEYDAVSSYQSPSLSPVSQTKNTFAGPSMSAAPTPHVSQSSQLPGPSHQYGLYKQQTGIVPGALASTLAVNQANSQVSGFNGYDMGYLDTIGESDVFDFNTTPSQPSSGSLDIDMDFDSPPDSQFLFPNNLSTINPSAIGGHEAQSPVTPVVPAAAQSQLGRVWPGMHTQAARANAQQRQQQQQQQQQMLQRQPQQQQPAKPRSKSTQPTDPLVEQKIAQLLNSMRAKSGGPDGGNDHTSHISRARKDEEDMDDDERLLASEEGKKLSSKERRQLRNKVSARAFRSRRKEYITQLEAEIATKVSENGDLRVANRSLVEENKRLQDLTRMLLSSNSFSHFLDNLSNNPQTIPAPQTLKSETRQPEPQQQQQQRAVPKDVNPYAANLSNQQQQIGMARIPEQSVDFSMLTLDGDAFNYQPQVFAVLETPDVPIMVDTSILSGKSSNFVGETFDSEHDKVELPSVEAPKEFAPKPQAAPVEKAEEVLDEDFENDPEFALYHAAPRSSQEPAAELDRDSLMPVDDLFGGIDSEKVLARLELVDASEEEATAAAALAKVLHISARLESTAARLERLTLDC